MLSKRTIKLLLLQTKTSKLSSKFSSNEICDKKEQFTENINISENFSRSIDLAYNKLTATNDSETYYSLFYSKVI